MSTMLVNVIRAEIASGVSKNQEHRNLTHLLALFIRFLLNLLCLMSTTSNALV